MGPEPDEAAPSCVGVAAVVVMAEADADDTMFEFNSCCCFFCEWFSCAPLRQRILVVFIESQKATLFKSTLAFLLYRWYINRSDCSRYR